MLQNKGFRMETRVKRTAKAEEEHRAKLEAKSAECNKSCESSDRACAMAANQYGYSVGQQIRENRECSRSLKICKQRCGAP
jgi:hypothetical protein